MKKPLAAIISVAAVLGAGLYVGYKYRDQGAEYQQSGTWRGPAARSKVQEYLELILPMSAQDVLCRAEELGSGKFVYIKFDVASADVAPLLAQSRGVENIPSLPPPNSLVKDVTLQKAMAELADPRSRPWWQVDQLADAVCGQRSGTRNLGPAQLKWRVQVCYAHLNTSMARMYIAFSEEAVKK